MFKKINSEYMSWMLIIGAIILLLDIIYFSKGIVFSLFIAIAMVYFGRKSMAKKLGQLLFWGGLVLLIVSIFQMMTFSYLLLAVLLYFVIQFAQSKKEPKLISPVIKLENNSNSTEKIISTSPIFPNKIFGNQKTPKHVYEWKDINIQGGVGDTLIDLSYTVLPKGETVIILRNLIGKVQIFVPYDYEVMIHHSVMYGMTTVFDFHESKMLNQTLHIQTVGYEKAEQKIKILSSLFVGDIEVKRI